MKVCEGEPVTLRRTRDGKTVVWTIRFDGDTILKSWGQEGGKMQDVSDVEPPVNVGKANERTGAQQAKLRVEREVRKRLEEGFRLTGEEDVEEIDPVAGPPSRFRGPKPQNTAPKSLMGLWGTNKLRVMRKHNGMCYPIFINSNGDPIIFSRTFIPTARPACSRPWTERFPLITDFFRSMASPIRSYAHGEERLLPPSIPPMSLFMTEIVAPWWDKEEKCLIDDFPYVGSVCRATTETALQTQEEASNDEQSGYLVAVVLDVWMWGGEDVLTGKTFFERRELLERKFPDMTGDSPVLLVTDETSDPSSAHMTPEEFLMYAVDVGWEGYVLVNGAAKFPEGSLNFTGNIKRPVSYGKLKPKREDDFIGLWEPEKGAGSYGKGKHQEQIGAIALYQFDKDGELVYVSDCGIGFSDAQKRKWADPGHWPKVVQVQFDSKTAGGSLHLPRFVGVRTDKEMEECRLEE